ncbi:sialidase family protein [Aestuariivivens sediminicola]|uniref:sialidase family protein n=1 Tax=Aestuariivivens sediminicola TaxID=2913560 RepID=UPI001F59044A|nr:sialidase family protein [Aestuariivivens sediminicola]
MIKYSVMFMALLLLSNCKTKSNNEKIDSHVHPPESVSLFKTGMQEGVSCYRIPSVVTTPNGHLLAAIDQRVPSCGDLKWSKNINIVTRRSEDNGKSWTPIETVIDFPEGQSASDPSMIVDNMTGTIFLFYNYMNLETEKDIYYLHVMQSTDDGKTWSEPKDITSQITTSEWEKDFKFITSGRGIQTRSGKLLHTMVNLNRGLHIFGSDDHGKTWYFIDQPIQPGDESKIVELADGTLMINSRVNKKGMRYVHRSTDEGQTWVTKAETELIDPGCNASIIRYTSTKDGFAKNRLLFSNAKSAKDRMNMTVRISYDEGLTWSEGKTIYAGSSAYSSLTVLPNGDIGLFFEKDDYTNNEFTSFSLEWLTDGEDKLEDKKR